MRTPSPPRTKPSAGHKFTVVSLFSGAGGLDIGFEKTDRFEILACVEKVPAFCETIRRNRDAGRTARRDLRVYEADVSDDAAISPQQLLEDLGMRPGEIDVVIGGPPCQAFSTTGRRGTVQDTRGTLLWQFLRYIDYLQPKMFVMENVRGLMSAAVHHRPIAERPDKGGSLLKPDEEPGSVLRAFLRDLHDKYRMDAFEVNAVNYGAPQLRERVLFIGNRYGRLTEFPAPTHGVRIVAPPGDAKVLSLFDEPNDLSPQTETDLLPFRTLGEALAGLHDPEPVIMDFSPRKKKYLSAIPPGGNWRCMPEAVAREAMGKAYLAKGGRSGWWRRLSFDLPSPTILTLPNHSGTALCHPTEVRALTLRECARVQEFPDEWEFAGSTAEQYAQVGNAVPTRLGTVCAEVVASHLNDIYEGPTRSDQPEAPPFRVVYVKSHIRTRKWFKDGETFVWQDGEANDSATYGPAKTEHKVRMTV